MDGGDKANFTWHGFFLVGHLLEDEGMLGAAGVGCVLVAHITPGGFFKHIPGFPATQCIFPLSSSCSEHPLWYPHLEVCGASPLRRCHRGNATCFDTWK